MRSSIPFFLANLHPARSRSSPASMPVDLVLLAVLFYVRMFFVTAGYHRYFSHRSYKLGRVRAVRDGLWRRDRGAEGPALVGGAPPRPPPVRAIRADDVHSPMPRLLVEPRRLDPVRQDRPAPTYDRIKDFAKYPELRFLNTHDWIAPWTLGLACVPDRRVEWARRRVLRRRRCCCGTRRSRINSLAHVFGRRRYDTPDTSRNSFLSRSITGGEGWHNNHHYYQASAAAGLLLVGDRPRVLRGCRVLSWIGIVRDARTTPAPATSPRRHAERR